MTSAVQQLVYTAGKDIEPQGTAKKAVFFDRDGTLIKDVGYLNDTAQIELLPNVVESLQRLQALGYALFVVTNQSGVGRGYFSEYFVQLTHAYLDLVFTHRNVKISKWFYCPHSAKDECTCRKPGLGMVSNLTGIAWEHSWMLGDKITDVQFGLNAGMRSILIDSNGDNGVLFSTVPDIQKAVEVICANETNS
jgi:D-glycero-D-manno-heptose 1,7-bisphosphate phosphatase